MSAFRVSQIDHVELFVPDRREAALWYQRALGLDIVAEHEDWEQDPQGPLMISSDGGGTKLALFQGEPQRERATAGFHRVAFSVDAAGFAACLRHLAALGVTDRSGQVVGAGSAVDHDTALSIYFSDPYGHRLEVTTYDCVAARAALEKSS